MWPLLAASVLGLALILDRTIVFLWCGHRLDRLREPGLAQPACSRLQPAKLHEETTSRQMATLISYLDQWCVEAERLQATVNHASHSSTGLTDILPLSGNNALRSTALQR